MNVQDVIDQLRQKADKVLSDSNQALDLLKRAQLKYQKSSMPQLTAVRDDIELLFAMLKDYIKGTYRQVPWQSLIMVTASLIYFLNPLDMIPDFIPLNGLIDDASVLVFTLRSIKEDITKYKSWKESKF